MNAKKIERNFQKIREENLKKKLTGRFGYFDAHYYYYPVGAKKKKEIITQVEKNFLKEKSVRFSAFFLSDGDPLRT